MARHIIIGGGPAGVATAETIRSTEGNDAEITIISNEPVYSRMVLPYYLAKDIPEEHVLTGTPSYFEEHGIKSVTGQVEKIDSVSKSVTLDDGSTLAFDNLCIATGSSPQRPPIDGIDEEGVFTFWTLEDAQKVAVTAKGTPRAVLIGAGFIGFIVLNAMSKLGWDLSVVETESQILPRMLDATGASAVNGWLTRHGVSVHTSSQVQRIARNGTALELTLNNNTKMEADIVILATGIRPNLNFLAGSGIETNAGILVNERMETNISGIYAVGDVAAGPDLLGGAPAVHAIQPTAVDHGRIAGANMAGTATRYPGSLSLNVLDVINLHCASFGHWQDQGHDTTVAWNETRPIYRKYVWDKDRIVGALFVGPIDDVTMLNDVGMIKGLIQTKQALGNWANYVKQNPTDVRRAYVGTGTAQQLIGKTLLATAARDRAYRVTGKTPAAWQKPDHAPLIESRPSALDTLPRTPTPGIEKGD